MQSLPAGGGAAVVGGGGGGGGGAVVVVVTGATAPHEVNRLVSASFSAGSTASDHFCFTTTTVRAHRQLAAARLGNHCAASLSLLRMLLVADTASRLAWSSAKSSRCCGVHAHAPDRHASASATT